MASAAPIEDALGGAGDGKKHSARAAAMLALNGEPASHQRGGHYLADGVAMAEIATPPERPATPRGCHRQMMRGG